MCADRENAEEVALHFCYYERSQRLLQMRIPLFFVSSKLASAVESPTVYLRKKP